MNDLKNMLVIRDLPSNLIEEAYIVLKPNLKLKIDEIEKSKKEDKEQIANEENKILRKNYILEEAKCVLLNYISRFETKTEKINNKMLEKKYKKLKKITLFTILSFFIYILITNL